MSGGSYALGSGPTTFSPQQIVFYKMTTSGTQYSFLSGSGLVTSNIDINTFVQDVVAGTESVSVPLPSGQSPPNLTVTVPCYVVVQLDSAVNWQFLPGSASILTDSDCSSKYRNLYLVDTNGTVYSGQAPSSSSPPPVCLIMYFSVVSVAPASQNVTDLFSYYFQITQQGGDTYTLVLDPGIRNKGPG